MKKEEVNVLIDSEGYEYIIKDGKKELIDKSVIKNWR